MQFNLKKSSRTLVSKSWLISDVLGAWELELQIFNSKIDTNEIGRVVVVVVNFIRRNFIRWNFVFFTRRWLSFLVPLLTMASRNSWPSREEYRRKGKKRKGKERERDRRRGRRERDRR